MNPERERTGRRFGRVLIANRGEIAVRIIRACRALGIETVLAVSEADRESLGARLADRSICIGPAAARSSYLDANAVLSAATATSCDALHPGYGFLAENGSFARRCDSEGVAFIGPSPDALDLLGDKVAARAAARRCSVPMLEGTGELATVEEALGVAAELGFPLLLKASHGGGGRGIRLVGSHEALAESFETANAEALATFGAAGCYLERYVEDARHVEVQIAGDGERVVHLGDRDCSIQRRHQKLVEEAPAPGLAPRLQDELRAAAVRLAASTRYDSVGTVEFLVDARREEFYFLEVNPRLQVEHGVTELVTGIDVVALQLIVAESGRLPLAQEAVQLRGHAIECRINAEDPLRDFAPSPGRITAWELPHDLQVRVDTHCFAGYSVPPFYDSLVAKVMSSGSDREEAIAVMCRALGSFVVAGISSTASLCAELVASQDFATASISTVWLDRLLARDGP